MAVEGNKLFVGQVPNATTEEQLQELFSPYGTVTDVMFLKNKATGQHRGCAFVTYSTPEEAQAAIDNLHETVTLPGANRTLIIRVAGQNRQNGADADHKLYVAMLSRSTTVEELRSIFEAYGNVLDSFLMHEKGDPTKSRGCGFIKYSSRDEAIRAINALHGKHTDKDAPRPIQVRFAHTKAEKDQNTMGGFGMVQPFMQQMPNMGMGWQNYGGQADPYGNGFGMGPDMGMMQQQPQFGGMGMVGGFNQQQQQGGGGGAAVSKGPPGANLFVYGIPDTYRDTDLATLFSGFGNIVSAKVQVDLSSGRSKGFGFVSFDTVPNAQAAIGSMDGFILQGKKLNVRVKKGAGDSNGNSQQRFTPY